MTFIALLTFGKPLSTQKVRFIFPKNSIRNDNRDE